MSNRIENAYDDPHGRGFVGDDLSEKDLDDLYKVWYGSQNDRCTDIGYWWYDKPQQIAHRLLMRLTRAEETIKVEHHSHEGQENPRDQLRCTLSSIRGWIDNLKDGCSSPEKVAERVNSDPDRVDELLKRFPELKWKD